MRMAKILRPALALVGASTPRADRSALAAAIATRDAAVQAVAEAQSTLDHLQVIVDQAHDAARAAAKAARAVTEARAAWVAGGCKFSVQREIQALENQAEEDARAAERAALSATTVGAELARARSAIQDARSAVELHEREIADAVGQVIAAEEAQLLERFQRAATEYQVLRIQVMALRGSVDAWEGRRYAAAPSREAVAAVDAGLEAGRILDFEREREDARLSTKYHGVPNDFEEAFTQGLTRWRDRAAQLRESPES
jgi:hypothetical protein